MVEDVVELTLEPAQLLVDGRVETVEATGPDLISLVRPLVERAAELRLAAAFWRIVGPT